MAVRIPQGLLKEASQVEDRGAFNLSDAELVRMLREGVPRAAEFEQFRRGAKGGLGVGNVGQNAPASKPSDAAAAIVDKIVRNSGVNFEGLSTEEKRALFNTADRVLRARDKDKGPLGFLTEGKFAIPAILGGGLALGLSGAGAGAGSVGANIGGTTVGASAPTTAGTAAGVAGGSAAATGNFVPAAHATSTTAVTAQTAGAPQFLGSTAGFGAGGSLGVPAIRGNPLSTATSRLSATRSPLREIDTSKIPGKRPVPGKKTGLDLSRTAKLLSGLASVVPIGQGAAMDISPPAATSGPRQGGTLGDSNEITEAARLTDAERARTRIPRRTDQAIQRARTGAQRKARQRMGRSSTILTSARGLPGGVGTITRPRAAQLGA